MEIHVFVYVRIRARWIGPYAWRIVRHAFRGCMWVFHGLFVGILWNVRHVIGNPSAALSQSVSSCRGRFIVPAYTKTPTKWGTKMRVWWNECLYLIMWICVFNETDTHFWLRQDTGTMNRPLRLADCSPRISWVYVECFAEYSPRIRNPFRMHSRNVRNVFVICVLHIRHGKVWFLGLMVKCTPERGQKCSLFHLMVKCTPIIVELPSVYRGCKPLICFQ